MAKTFPIVQIQNSDKFIYTSIIRALYISIEKKKWKVIYFLCYLVNYFNYFFSINILNNIRYYNVRFGTVSWNCFETIFTVSVLVSNKILEKWKLKTKPKKDWIYSFSPKRFRIYILLIIIEWSFIFKNRIEGLV